MSKICYICGKEAVGGNRISHSNKKSKRKFFPNLQNVKIVENGVVRQRKVCTSCLKSGKVQKKISIPKEE